MATSSLQTIQTVAVTVYGLAAEIAVLRNKDPFITGKNEAVTKRFQFLKILIIEPV